MNITYPKIILLSFMLCLLVVATQLTSCSTKSDNSIQTSVFFAQIDNPDFKEFLSGFRQETLPYKLSSYQGDNFAEIILSNDSLAEIERKHVKAFLELIEPDSKNGPMYGSMLSYYALDGDMPDNPRFYYKDLLFADSAFAGVVFVFDLITDSHEDITGSIFATFDKFGNPITSVLLSYHYFLDINMQIRMFSDATIDINGLITVTTITRSQKQDSNKNGLFKSILTEQYQIESDGKIRKLDSREKTL